MGCLYVFSVFNIPKQIFPPSGPLATQPPLDCNRFVCFFLVRLFRRLQGSNLAKNQRQTCITLFVSIIKFQKVRVTAAKNVIGTLQTNENFDQSENN